MMLNNSVARITGSRRMLRFTGNISTKLQLLLDVLIVEASLFLCIYVKAIPDFTIYYYPAIVAPVLMWLVYSNSGVYRRHTGKISRILSISFAWTKVVAALIVLAFMLKVSEQYSRQVIISWFIISAPIQMIVHIALNKFVHEHMKREAIPSIVVGNSELGAYLTEHINSNPWTAHKIVGVISENKSDEVWHAEGLPQLGSLEELRDVVVKMGLKRVYFALPMNTSHQIRDMQLELIDLNVDIVWAPDIFGLHMVSPSVKEVAGVPLYYLSESPMVEGAWLSKLLFDKIISVVALLLLSPVMILSAIAIKLSSSGPVFFHQERHGLDGKIIKIFKFRSMQVHDEPEGVVSQAVRGDARLTRVGAFLRKTSIDELPQIFNVLKGEMSLVGPRPHAKSHNYYYSEKSMLICLGTEFYLE